MKIYQNHKLIVSELKTSLLSTCSNSMWHSEAVVPIISKFNSHNGACLTLLSEFLK